MYHNGERFSEGSMVGHAVQVRINDDLRAYGANVDTFCAKIYFTVHFLHFHTLSNYHTLTLLHFHILSHFKTVTLSHFHYFTPLHFHTFTLSFFNTFTPKSCQKWLNVAKS